MNHDAWNNFVMNTDSSKYGVGSMKRAAAIANLYWGLANNGGINSFLTSSYDLDASEVLASLETIGATQAAQQFRKVLDKLDSPLPASSHATRWDQLDSLWNDELDDIEGFDVLSSEADSELAQKLEHHVSEYNDFYLSLVE